jgi:hypothetical protein
MQLRVPHIVYIIARTPIFVALLVRLTFRNPAEKSKGTTTLEAPGSDGLHKYTQESPTSFAISLPTSSRLHYNAPDIVDIVVAVLPLAINYPA